MTTKRWPISKSQEVNWQVTNDPTEWRTRFRIMSAALLSDGVYRVDGAEINVLQHQELVDGTSHYLIDVRTEAISIEDAAIIAIDVANHFLDRLSLLSYGLSRLIEFISTCPVSVKVGGEFDLLVMNLSFFRSPVPVTPADVTALNDIPPNAPSSLSLSLRHLRDGLSGNDLVDRYLALWRALELIAEAEATDRIETICQQCGYVVHSHPASQRRMRQLFTEAGCQTSDADEARSLRGQYTHGTGIRDAAGLDELRQMTALIQSVGAGILANRFGQFVLDRRNLIIGLPFIVHKIQRLTDMEYAILPDSSAKFPVLGTEVSLIGAKNSSGTIEVGVRYEQGRPVLPDLALPV